MHNRADPLRAELLVPISFEVRRYDAWLITWISIIFVCRPL